MVMEEFRNIATELATNDWNKRLRAIDTMLNFVNTNINTIKSAPPSKFFPLIDSFCKLLNDNNAKVLTQAQVAFKNILLNGDLKAIIDPNLTMIVQSLC